MLNKNTEIPQTRSDNPNQPVPTFLQEADNLYVWCMNDAKALNRVGITSEMIEELPLRTSACREAEAVWKTYKDTPSEAEKQWKILAPQALKFRTNLLQTMHYAFRKEPTLQASLSSISKGTGYANLIQNLNDLCVLGKNNTELLVKINFDLKLLDIASAKSKELAESWAAANVNKDYEEEYKQKRNRAFWHLHALLTEIRVAGRYVFRKDKSRYTGYTSTYWKNKNTRKTKAKTPTTPNSTLNE